MGCTLRREGVPPSIAPQGALAGRVRVGQAVVLLCVAVATATAAEGASVTVSETTLTVAEAGGTATYTVKLDAAPTGAVTVTPTSGDESVATASDALTFTTTNYSTPQTVTVTGIDDDVDNASDRTATITHAAAGGGYDGIAAADVTVTATDDDSAGVALSTRVLRVPEVGSTTYTVKLETKPTGDVQVSPFSTDTKVATTSPSLNADTALTFTPTNWNTAQTVTVSGVDDGTAHSLPWRRSKISHRATGGGYGALAINVIHVILDPAAEPVATIRDNGDPNERVDIVILGDGFTADEQSFFRSHAASLDTALFRDAPFREYAAFFNVHTIDVVSEDSGVDHASRRIFRDTALGAHYGCAGIESLVCLNEYALGDVLGRSVDAAARDLVLVLINETEIGASGGGYYAVSSLHWSLNDTMLHEIGHSFGLLADEYTVGGHLCASGEPPEPNVTRATIRDRIKWNAGGGPPRGWIAADRPLPSVDQARATPGLYEGAKYCGSGVFRPTYNSKMRNPLRPWDVVNQAELVKAIYGRVSPIREVRLPKEDLTFPDEGEATFLAKINRPTPDTTSVAWLLDDEPVGSADELVLQLDGLAAGSHTLSLVVSDNTTMVRHDPDNLLRQEMSWDLTIAASLGVTLSPLTLTVPEAGSATYTVKLDAAPTADVTVTPSSGDVSVATVSPASLTFTTDNYGTPQAVTVTGGDDAVENPTDRQATVTHAAAGGGYASVAVASVTVTVTDDDSAGVTVSGTALTVAEAGGRATYTIKLDAEPTGSVTVTPTSGNATVAIVSPGQLTFTTDNYATPQTVTVTGVNDAVDNATDRRATTVTHAAAGGGYDGVAVASVTVTATDDDSAGVTVSETALTVAEAGGTATYTLRLDTKPTGSVTVTPTTDDTSVATASGALTFTTANYSTPQSVTVTGIDDDVDNATDRTAEISHAAAGGGYDGVRIDSVVVTATNDDEGPGVTLSTLTLTLPEAGEATYTAKLDTKPTGDVLVAPFSVDTRVATVSPSFYADTALTFTPSNWNTPQTVTVTGVDDAVSNTEARTTAIGHWAVGGGYGLLGELAIDDVAVTLVDDEESPTVSMATPSQAVDEGDAATVTLTLSAPLGAAVAVPLSYSHLNSEPDDIEALTEIVMPAGQTSEIRDIRTRQDDDGDDEWFVVWIDEAKLPAYLHRGADHKVHIMIVDDDGAPDRVAEVRVVHNGTSLTASWDAPARATAYDVTYYNHRTGENARAAWDRAGTSLTITCDVRPEHLGEYCVDGDSAYTVGVRAGNAAGKSPWVDSARVEPPAAATAWLFPSASDPSRRGVLRVSNRSGTAGEVSVTATDDAGRTHAPLTLAVAAGATVEFDSRDLESGGAGLSGATGPGTGDWRLVIDGGALDIEALPYVRVAGDFAAPMDATAPRDASGALRVALFNPGGEQDARSLLRLVNPGSAEARASVSGVDDAGRSPGASVLLTVPAGAACTVDAAELETGTGLACGPPQQGLGNGSGRWRLAVSSDAPLVAMNLLASPDGRLANLSRISAADANGMWHVPLFPSASSASGRQGLVRVVSRAQRPGAVSILATDDSGAAYPAVTLPLPPGAAVDLDADDLELGSRQKGLSGGTGSGTGAWRLALSGDVAFATLAYARSTDGFLTPMRTAAPGAGGRLAYLAPDAGVLRLANAGTADAMVTVAGTDDLGAPSASAVRVAVPAGTAVELPASALESGKSAAIVSGALGDGAGVWRLSIGSDAEAISAMSLLPGPMGSLADLSGPAPATKTEHAVSR